MHGLIFETSIWLLAGSTRFLTLDHSHQKVAWNRSYQTVFDFMALNGCLLGPPDEIKSIHASTMSFDQFTWGDLRGVQQVPINPSYAVLYLSRWSTDHFCKKLDSPCVQIQIPTIAYERQTTRKLLNSHCTTFWIHFQGPTLTWEQTSETNSKFVNCRSQPTAAIAPVFAGRHRPK